MRKPPAAQNWGPLGEKRSDKTTTVHPHLRGDIYILSQNQGAVKSGFSV